MQRRRRGLLLPRPFTTAAVMLCILAALELAPGVAAAGGVSASPEDCVVLVRTNTVQVQARVRQSPFPRMPQPANLNAALQPPPVIRSEHALSIHAVPANRQRLARLTTLRI